MGALSSEVRVHEARRKNLSRAYWLFITVVVSEPALLGLIDLARSRDYIQAATMFGLGNAVFCAYPLALLLAMFILMVAANSTGDAKECVIAKRVCIIGSLFLLPQIVAVIFTAAGVG